MSAPGTVSETLTLLHTKLHKPGVTGDLVSRPRLIEQRTPAYAAS